MFVSWVDPGWDLCGHIPGSQEAPTTHTQHIVWHMGCFHIVRLCLVVGADFLILLFNQLPLSRGLRGILQLEQLRVHGHTLCGSPDCLNGDHS